MPKARILVVEDDDMARDMLEKLLIHLGHEVIIAKDGITGLQAYDAHLPDIVISDLGMPHKTGLELIEKKFSWQSIARQHVDFYVNYV